MDIQQEIWQEEVAEEYFNESIREYEEYNKEMEFDLDYDYHYVKDIYYQSYEISLL